MHYLENDIELLDGVTEELKLQCYEMRDLDTRAERALYEIRENSRSYFNNIKNFPDEERKIRCEKIKEDYRKIREISEEKLAIAEFLELMFEKYQERIAKDLNEFKLELETDTPGITSTIEKELCETLKNANNHKKLKSLVIAQPYLNAKSEIEISEDSGFEDIKPSTSTNYRVNGNRHGNYEPAETLKTLASDQNTPLTSPSRNLQNHKRTNLFTQISSGSRISGVSTSNLSDSQKFFSLPNKRKYLISSSSNSSTLHSNSENKPKKLRLTTINAKTVSKKSDIHFLNSTTMHQQTYNNDVRLSPFSDKPLYQFPLSAKLNNQHTWSNSTSTSPNSHQQYHRCDSSAATSPSPPLNGNRLNVHDNFYQSTQPSTQTINMKGMPIVPNNVSTTQISSNSAVSMAMPSFAGSQESQYGRLVKLTTRVQEMLKDRQTHRVGRSTSISIQNGANHPQTYSAETDDNMRYNSLINSTCLIEDENRGHGFRKKAYSNNQRRRRVLLEEDDDETEILPFEKEEELENVLTAKTEDIENKKIEIDEEDDDQDNRIWCLCQQKSEGDMVACDNKNCPYEWFHYECVAITAPPRGKWFCPVCTKNLRRSRSISMESH